jgi:hypothetical protein
MAPDRGAAQMTRRKGEITLPDIKRHWPHHVALPADKVRGVVNSQIVWSFAETLSVRRRGCIPSAVMTLSSWCSASPRQRMRRGSASVSVGSVYRRRGGEPDVKLRI